MEENKQKETADSKKDEVKAVKKPRRITRSIHDILGGDYLSKERVIKNLPYLFFLTVIAIIYIANTYYAEKTFKQIEITKSELKELRFQYLTTKSILMYYSKQTEIAKRAAKHGLKETTVPPYKIYYSKDTNDAGNKH